jgi:hypothetical protein
MKQNERLEEQLEIKEFMEEFIKINSNINLHIVLSAEELENLENSKYFYQNEKKSLSFMLSQLVEMKIAITLY